MTIHFSAKPGKRTNEISLADSAIIAYKNDPAGSKWNIFQAYLKGKFAGEEEKILPIIEIEAEKGSSSAQSALGEIILYGIGTPKDIGKAILWLEKAVEQKDGKAQYLLGTLLEKENPEKALRLYIEAFHAGIKESAYPLGRYCELGICMPKLIYMAAYWYKIACENGDEQAKDAYERVVSILGKDKWQEEIKKLFKNGAFPDTIMLAEGGDAKEQYELGKIYMDGIFTSKNPELAIEWFRKSATQGYFKAFYQIGLAYYEGIGIGRDLHQAADYFRKGAEAGHNEALYALGCLYEEGQGVEKNMETARYWYQKAIEAKFPPNGLEDTGHWKATEALEKLDG